MSDRKIRPAAWVIAAVIILAGLLAFGVARWVGSDDEPVKEVDTTEGSDSHADIDPVRDDPVSAVTLTMTAILSYRPAEQDTPFEQYGNVRDNLTGNLAETADNPPTGDEAAKLYPRQWESWKRSGDRVQAFVSRTGEDSPIGPDDAEGTVSVGVEQVVIHPDGDRTPVDDYTAEVTVVAEDGRWKLSEYQRLPAEPTDTDNTEDTE